MNREVQRQATHKRCYDLEERLIAFACRALEVAEALPRTTAGVHIAGQLTRAGTSPASNYAEAMGAESRRDFIHKIRICLKELRESRVWLLIIRRRELIRPASRLDPILAEAAELIAIFARSVTTAKRNAQSRPGARTAGEPSP
jgi:four helix bundle protein